MRGAGGDPAPDRGTWSMPRRSGAAAVLDAPGGRVPHRAGARGDGAAEPDPVVPALAGGLVILNAAVVDGPLGAFRLFSRRAHRIADLVVIGVLVVLAVLPWLDVDNASRILHRRVRRDPRVRVVELVVRAPRRSARPAGQPRRPQRGDRPLRRPRRRRHRPPCVGGDRDGRPSAARCRDRTTAPVACRPWRSTDRPPTSQKLIAAWEQFEGGEETPGKVLANLKTAGLPEVLRQLADEGWTPSGS